MFWGTTYVHWWMHAFSILLNIRVNLEKFTLSDSRWWRLWCSWSSSTVKKSHAASLVLGFIKAAHIHTGSCWECCRMVSVMRWGFDYLWLAMQVLVSIAAQLANLFKQIDNFMLCFIILCCFMFYWNQYAFTGVYPSFYQCFLSYCAKKYRLRDKW